MRIGISTAFLDRTKGGTWVYTRNLITHLVSLDLENEYFLIDSNRTQSQGGVQTIVLPFPDIRFAKFVWPNFILPKGGRRHGLDVVHITNPYGTFLNSGYRNVITIHDITPVLYPETHNWMNVLHHQLVLPSILGRADAVITDSWSSKRDIVEYCQLDESKVRAIYLGVEPQFCPTAEMSDFLKPLKAPYVLNIGTLEPRKNVKTLLQAFAMLKGEGFEHTLVIGGPEGWMLSGLGELIEGLNLEDEVTILGAVPRDLLPGLYSSASLFVYPSLYEGFGLPPLEAMACGTPVITSRSSSLPEVVGDAARLVDPNSVEEIAGAMTEVLSDSRLADDMVRQGLERAKLFSWEKTARETLKVYEEVVNR